MLAAVALPFPLSPFLPCLRKVSFSRIVIVAVDALGIAARSHRAGGEREGEGDRWAAVVAAEGEAEGAEDRAAPEVSRVYLLLQSIPDVWSNGLYGQSSCGPDWRPLNLGPL